MILTGPEIRREIEAGRIVYDPFDPARLNPNSVNFTLGSRLLVYRDRVLDAAVDNPVEEIVLDEDGLVLEPERLYLGHIVERIGSDHYVPIMRGRSSTGRLGLFINITADLIDQGAVGCWTLMLSAVQPVRVYPGMLVGQMTFWRPSGEPMLYEGKYGGATGPQSSQSWREHGRLE